MKRLLVTLATLGMVILLLPQVSFCLSLSGKGSATINGVMSPGEWDNAAKVDFLANLPGSGGGTIPATMYVMNDELNLYIAIKIAQPSFGPRMAFSVAFDNNNNGILNDGEDVIMMVAGDGHLPELPAIPPKFEDDYGFTTAGGIWTSSTDSVQNISGSANYDGTVTIVEMSHLLCSKDPQDICLAPGSTVGFRAALSLYGTAPTGVFVMGALPTPPRVDTLVPASGFGQIVIPQVIVPGVTIDIKPGSSDNSINMKSQGKIPVAILSTPTWSAPANVESASLTFGHDGTETRAAFCNGDQDVNNDGIPDLVCHFPTQATGFQTGDTTGILKGKTKNGAFTANDAVRIVK